MDAAMINGKKMASGVITCLRYLCVPKLCGLETEIKWQDIQRESTPWRCCFGEVLGTAGKQRLGSTPCNIQTC
jgi:hypothetical protein